jgi:predicted acylesterase/phospholipase RssA
VSRDAGAAPARIGLALSGGGFRAAFFHVGVLQRLAEVNLLRSVRMLSCVSGGSIAGAVYYLTLVRQLMVSDEIEPGMVPAVRGAALTSDEYALCVEQTRQILLAAVRSNVRATVFRNPWKNLTMFLSPRYSRTDRAGDMLDKRMREGVGIKTGYRYPGVARQLELRTLHLQRSDVPRLALNATTLNTGHAWRFETDGMGELMPLDRRSVDKNAVLAWTHYADLPEEQANFPLAVAVAASAAFPGLFRPLPIGGLYDRRVDLMDGGAQDNQGIQTLMDAGFANPYEPLFDRIIVSDGSGRLEDEGTKRRSIVALGRIIGIQGDRIREEQLLAAQHRFVEGGGHFDLVDLRHGLPYSTVGAGGTTTTAGGTASLVRARLAQLRTDLDAFGSLETKLLDQRGYEVAAAVLPETGAEAPAVPEVAPKSREDRALQAGGSQLWKPLRVWRLHVLPLVVLVGAALAGAYAAVRFFGPDPSLRRAIAPVALATFFLLPVIASRGLLHLARRLAPSRPVKWVTGFVLYGLLFALAAWQGPTVAGWGRVSWSRLEAGTIAGGLLVAPAVLPFIVALLMWLEGLWWKRLTRA